LRFATSDATSSLGSGERWCSSRAGLPAFVAFVHGSAPFVALADRTDGVVAIELEEAG
jgi:hypothetical protein